MTVCWKLPKAHGREWVVPLLTEPGIDINWKARYDFFKMVDGVPVDPKSIDENGKYTGKVKKGEYFHGGKIYQEIPDWLKPHIKRGDMIGISETPNVAEAQINKPVAAPAPPEVKKHVDESEIHLEVSDPEAIEFDYSDPPEADDKPHAEEIPKVAVPTALAPPPKTPEPTRISDPQRTLDWSPPIQPAMELYRMIWRSEYNERNLKKLNAIIILAEGDVPLRIVNTEGKILIHESDSSPVNPVEFDLLCKLFGIG
jgi:hypothetical protein